MLYFSVRSATPAIYGKLQHISQKSLATAACGNSYAYYLRSISIALYVDQLVITSIATTITAIRILEHLSSRITPFHRVVLLILAFM